MSHQIYHTKYISTKNKSKELGTFGKLGSAHGVVDRMIQRILNRYKRQMIGRADIRRVENDQGVHTFVRITIKAHNYTHRVICRHFVVEEEKMFVKVH